jgi:hypothetical protein
MIFSLEALEAGQGDALLLHYGSTDKPLVAVIDGGPGGIYKRSLRPRLEQLRAARNPGGPLELELLAVSHIDDDHIRGVLDLTAQLMDEEEENKDRSYEIRALWHNSFNDVVGDGGVPGTLPASVATLGTGGASAADLLVSRPTELVVASIDQGRRLRDNARGLALDVNTPFQDVVVAPREVDWRDGLKLRVLSPDEDRLADLHEKWDAFVRKKQAATASAAAFLDTSVFNLSSIVVLAQAGGKTMLLTGDARGDDILAGLEQAGLLANPPLEVDVLKLPHHGSDRNVETDFFRKIVARHYVISGDGTDGNPETATLKMIAEARDDDDFALHLTNRTGKGDLESRLEAFAADEKRRGRKFELSFRDSSALSMKVELLDPVPD